MSHSKFWTVYLDTGRPVHFHAPGPSTFVLQFIRTVHISSNGRPLRPVTVHSVSKDRPVWLKTVYFWMDRPGSRDRPLPPLWTVHFEPDSLKILSWTWTRLF